MILALVALATLDGSVILHLRHRRRLWALDNRRRRVISMPTGILYVNKRLTDAEADAIEAKWLESYARSPRPKPTTPNPGAPEKAVRP